MHAQVEAGRRDDDVGLEHVTGREADALAANERDLVGDDGRLALPVIGREEVAVGHDGDALLPRAARRVEVAVDVEAVRKQRPDPLDQELADGSGSSTDIRVIAS